MRRVHVPLQHMSDIVVTYVMLYNKCAIGKDKCDKKIDRKNLKIIANAMHF